LSSVQRGSVSAAGDNRIAMVQQLMQEAESDLDRSRLDSAETKVEGGGDDDDNLFGGRGGGGGADDCVGG
jgi:hypothetical protein